jgi:hypothetical protein
MRNNRTEICITLNIKTELVPTVLRNYKTHISMEMSKSNLTGTFYIGSHTDRKGVRESHILQSNIREEIGMSAISAVNKTIRTWLKGLEITPEC